jgi:hypothetical protein
LSEIQHIAAPLSRFRIRQCAELVRRMAVNDAPWFDVVGFVEKKLPDLDDSFTFAVDERLPLDTHACTEIADRSILVRPEIYDRAVMGMGRDRMTIAHELGHLLLHSELRLMRRMSAAPIEAFRDPEWQAKCFAGELLISRRLYPNNKDPEEAADLFGVSVDSIYTQLAAWKREGR